MPPPTTETEMTNHFYAIDPQGNAHTRNSKGRVYAYTVVVRPGRDAVNRYLANIAKKAVAAGESYDRTVDESKGIFPQRELWRGQKALQSWTDFAIEYLATGPYSVGREAVVDKARSDAQQQAQDYERGMAWDRYHNVGWCSRRDLAEKLAAQQTGEQVVILEAQVGKPPKGGK